jgi:hypothetical protein
MTRPWLLTGKVFYVLHDLDFNYAGFEIGVICAAERHVDGKCGGRLLLKQSLQLW